MSVISLADQAFASSLPPLYAPAFTATSINLDETAPTGEIAQLRASIPAPGYAGITMNGYLQIKQATLALTDPSSQLLVNLPSDPGAPNTFANLIQASDFVPSNISATPNGYFQYGGLLVQWGFVSPGTPSHDTNFNAQFSANPYTIQTTAASAAATVIQVSASTPNDFSFINSTTQPFYWFAVGPA